jgi:hypothetical protein
MERCTLLATFCASALAVHAHAAVFERDWKVPGDGLLTYDDVNQREWLDVPLSLLAIYGNFDLVVAETGPGGDFEGFTPAKSDDVLALAQSAGIVVASTDIFVNGGATSALVSLLGGTSSTGNSSIGFLDELDPSPPSPATPRLIASIGVNPSAGFAGVFFFSNTSGLDPGAIESVAGVWLYRTVPEPTAFGQMALAIILVWSRCLGRRDDRCYMLRQSYSIQHWEGLYVQSPKKCFE